jgi:uncharacterized membrane protein
VHALLLAFPVAFFTGALLSDLTYLNSAEIQWSNFASWMIVGALVFGAPVLLWAALSQLRHRSDAGRTRAITYFALVARLPPAAAATKASTRPGRPPSCRRLTKRSSRR